MTISQKERVRREELATRGLKYCPKCGEAQKFAEFIHDRSRPDGLACWCRTCTAKNGHVWYVKKRQDAKWLANRRERDCKIHKREYVSHPRRKRTVAERRLSKRHQREYRRQWSIANHDRVLDYYRKYRETHPERREIERVRARERQQTEESYRQNRILISQRRRARKRATICTLGQDDVKTLEQFPCMFCGATENLTIAHDIPISRGGNTTRGNVFVLCMSCNCRMGTKSLAEIVEQGQLL